MSLYSKKLRLKMGKCINKLRFCHDMNCHDCTQRSFASVKFCDRLVDKSIDPRKIFKSANDTYGFSCDKCSHITSIQLKSIAKELKCHHCDPKGKFICSDINCSKCKDKSFASVPFSQNLVDKTINPRNISRYLDIDHEFFCDKCDHTFWAKPSNITKGTRCPYCAIPSRELCKNNNCESCFKRSFASAKGVKFWAYDKNKLPPRQVIRKSGKEYTFKCDQCNSYFEEKPIKMENYGLCNSCNDLNNIIPYDDSVASLEIANRWSPKNGIDPRDVRIGVNKKYLINCDKCKHEVIICMKEIGKKTKTGGCSYCAGRNFCANDDCVHCHDRSFASHEKSKYWSDENKISPRQVAKGANKKYSFQCDKCSYKFKMKPSKISGSNYWCPNCVNKTEKKLHEWLNKKIGEKYIIKEKPIDINEKSYRYDFTITNLNIIIELDGDQHFKEIKVWKNDPKKALETDIIKIKYANENNYTIIHLLQEDVFNNKNNWEEKLLGCLKKYDTPEIIFIDNQNIYKNHIDGIGIKSKVL